MYKNTKNYWKYVFIETCKKLKYTYFLISNTVMTIFPFLNLSVKLTNKYLTLICLRDLTN